MSKLNYKVRVLTPAEGFHCLSVKQEHGRNDKCPCGSGKKIKKCHTEYLEKKYYSSCPEKEDTTPEERKCKRDKVKIYKELK